MKKNVLAIHFIALMAFGWAALIVGFISNEWNIAIFTHNDRLGVFGFWLLIFTIFSVLYFTQRDKNGNN